MKCESLVYITALCSIYFTNIALAKKDYYEILGVKKDATEKQIKRAFPYEVLSDPKKRKNYDQFGDTGDQAGGGGGQGFDNFHFNFNDFFKGFDDAFHAHKDRHHQHQQHFNFGDNGGSFFNFDDLFDDEDEDDNGFFEPFGDSMKFSFGGFGDDDEDDLFGFHNSYDFDHNNIHERNMHRHQQNMNKHHNLHNKHRM
ncbi:hypothetical protein KUTeg_020366, partial [Tegillarca granosa]